MGVDLRCTGWFHRQSLMLDEHELLAFEHETTSDAIRRYRYDRLASLIIWRRLPWDRMITTVLVLGTPTGIVIGTAGHTPTGLAVGGVLFGVLLLFLFRQIIYRRTYIQLERDDGQTRVYAGILAPRRVNRFRDRLLDHIRAATQSTPDMDAPDVDAPVVDAPDMNAPDTDQT
ncbi:hypothetical protein ACERK3_16515 [Phycisphaerales bacterium AB-hyl4]|uniref:DUF4231 domain-containing protein n=1 Tax=Natronomicrosphaera hydrolytica TaxID=3242702 RepID=A0ABV4UBS5_9BACT